MRAKKYYLRYLFVPALVLVLVGVPLMLVRPDSNGVVFGGLMCTIAIVIASIGSAVGWRQPFNNVRTSS
jgi:hypothetical protein